MTTYRQNTSCPAVSLRAWRCALALAVLLASTFLNVHAAAPAQEIVLASTTSTEQSGLFAHLLPAFTQATGIAVKVVAVGTGQALDMGRRGDADVLLVHDREAEEAMVAQGYVVRRFAVMYNDFVLIGPRTDPAKVAGHDIVQAFRQLATVNANFISRGDNSGTHAAELRFWKAADQAPAWGSGYKSCGCGMGPALNMAAGLGAYVFADRGTWLNFRNGSEMAVLVQGDQRLFNQYGVMLVNPARFPHVRAQAGAQFIHWILSPAGQETIARYTIGAQQAFFPNANRD